MNEKVTILKTIICVTLLQVSTSIFCMLAMPDHIRPNPAMRLHNIVGKLKHIEDITPEQTDNLLGLMSTLLQNGIDINSRNYYGETLLQAYLTKVWADNTSQNLDPKVVRFLLKNGAHVNVQNNDETCLTFNALLNPNMTLEIIHLLKVYGFNTNQKIEGNPPLNIYVRMNPNPKLEIIRYMVERGAKINEKGATYGPPLTGYLAENRTDIKLEIVRFILEQGADIRYRDSYGRTPLRQVIEQAVENPNPSPNTVGIIRLLVINGADSKTFDSFIDKRFETNITNLMTYSHVALKLIKKGSLIPNLEYLIRKMQQSPIESEREKKANIIISLIRLACLRSIADFANSSGQICLEQTAFYDLCLNEKMRPFVLKIFKILEGRYWARIDRTKIYKLAIEITKRENLAVGKYALSKKLFQKTIIAQKIFKKIKRKKTTPEDTSDCASPLAGILCSIKQYDLEHAKKNKMQEEPRPKKRRREEEKDFQPPAKRRKTYLNAFVRIETQLD